MPTFQKKLAYISSMVTGGLAGFNYRELREMGRQGVDVDVFITKYRPGPYMPPEGMPVYKVSPVPILFAQPKRFLLSPIVFIKLFLEAISTKTVVDFVIAQEWAAVMRRRQRNWIHCHWGDHKLYIGYYCHKLLGIPLSVTLHGYDLYDNPNWLMLEKALRSCSQIITISEHNRQLLVKKYGKLGERVKVIRLFTDPKTAEKRRRIKRILIVGGFHPRKGHETLLEALRLLDRKDLHLWIVGYKGPVDVRRLVEESGVQDRVTFFGHISDEVLEVLYSCCDIFCLPARFADRGVGEGLPVALMEAMAHGKPIVSTVHTGIPELVPDILVPENDARGLAGALGRLADDAQLRESQGTRNQQIVERDYGPENVKKLLNVLTLDGASKGEE